MYIDERYILDFFRLMNRSKLRYVLIKNIAGELPSHLPDGKDIDVLVHPADKAAFSRVMEENGYLRIVHPKGPENGWKCSYGLEEPIKMMLRGVPFRLYIDANFQLCCQSFMEKIWVPLDRQINEDVWNGRVFDTDYDWWRMDDETTLIYLIVRSVFDKQEFQPGYIEQIQRFETLLDKPSVEEKLTKVFFRYTPRLLRHLRDREYGAIIYNYISFTDY